MVWFIVALVVVWVLWTQVRKAGRRRARRDSLHQDGAGYWIWTDFDGSTRRSDTHPDQPGGAWYAADHSGGDGGGFDGGDGGGDGGGGD